jgi:hypothetical protein
MVVDVVNDSVTRNTGKSENPGQLTHVCHLVFFEMVCQKQNSLAIGLFWPF